MSTNEEIENMSISELEDHEDFLMTCMARALDARDFAELQAELEKVRCNIEEKTRNPDLFAQRDLDAN